MWHEQAPSGIPELELESPFVSEPARPMREEPETMPYAGEASPFVEMPRLGAALGYEAGAEAELESELESELEAGEDAEHADGEPYLTMEGEALEKEAAERFSGEAFADETFASEYEGAFETSFGESFEPSFESSLGSSFDEASDVVGQELLEEELFATDALEAEDLATSSGSVDSFVTSLARVWEERKGGSVAEREAKLRQDHADTLAGARARARLLGRQPPPDGTVTRAWTISREQQMKFDTIASPVPRLASFALPAARPALVADRSVGGSDAAPVAPFTIAFVAALKRRFPGFSVWTYRGHGGSGFADRGYSLDFGLGGERDPRGFYPAATAVAFLRALHETARAAGAEWRAIYNDFEVADTLNRETGARRVIFVGTTRRNRAGVISNLNWHGPDPLILHVHVDLVPRAGGPGTGATAAGNGAAAAPRPGVVAKPPAELTQFAQVVLNAAEGERLAVDGDFGPRTVVAVGRFRSKHGLGPGGALDAATQLGLVQRALEELALQSMFAQTGVRDATTDREITAFRVRNGLGATATIDAALRAALRGALQRRSATVSQPAPGSASAPVVPPAGTSSALAALARLSSPSTPPTVANAVAITKLIAGHHGIPWRTCLTILAHEGGVDKFTHNDGVMQTIRSARQSVMPKIPQPLARALLGLPLGDATAPAALVAQLHAAFAKHLAVQIAAGIQELVVNLNAFDGYVALAYQAYNVGPGWSNYTVTNRASKSRPKNVSTEEWARMCREGATLMHTRADAVKVDLARWQCDCNIPTWFQHYAVFDKASGRQLIGYKYLRSFSARYRPGRPLNSTCTKATHGDRLDGTGEPTTATTRHGALDKLYDPSKLGQKYWVAVRAELSPIADDGLPLKVSGGGLVKVGGDGRQVPA